MSEQQTGSTQAAGNGSGSVKGLKAELDRVKHSADEVKAEVAAATDERRGGPAESVEDATSKAATLRRGIERDVAALRSRVPDGDAAKDRAIGTARTLGPPIGGGILVLSTIIVVFKRRGKRKRRDAEVHEQAMALARALARVELEAAAVPDDDDRGRGWLTWVLLGTAAAGGGAYAWQRSQQAVGIEDVFGAPQDDPLRPRDVTGT